jgi:hypothetical protein
MSDNAQQSQELEQATAEDLAVLAQQLGDLTGNDMQGLIVYYATLIRRFPNDPGIKLLVMKSWSQWPPELFQHFQSQVIGAVDLYWNSDQTIPPFWVRPAEINLAWGLG